MPLDPRVERAGGRREARQLLEGERRVDLLGRGEVREGADQVVLGCRRIARQHRGRRGGVEAEPHDAGVDLGVQRDATAAPARDGRDLARVAIAIPQGQLDAGGLRVRQLGRANRSHHVNRGGDAGLAQRERLFEGVHAEPRRVRRERPRHRHESVAVSVGFDDRRQPRGRDQLGQGCGVADDRAEVDGDLRFHLVFRLGRRYRGRGLANDATISATGIP